MAQVAVRQETTGPEAAPARKAGKPALTLVPQGGDMSGLLSLIGNAANLVAVHKERADKTEARSLEAVRRADAAEAHAADCTRKLEAASLALAEGEARLATVMQEIGAERARAADMQRRSAEIIEQMRRLLNQAGDRLREASSRAEKAEKTCTEVQQAVERQFTPLLG